MNRFLWLGMLLLMLSWLVPNHYFPWVAFYSDYMAFLSLFALFCAALYSGQFPVSWLSLTGLVVACIPLIQFLVGKIYFAGDALIAFAYIVALALAVLIGKGLSSYSKEQVYLAITWTFLLGATISALMAVGQWLRVTETVWIMDLPIKGRPYANFAQPNNLATLLSLGLAALAYLYEFRKFTAISAAFVAVVLLFCMALTESRTPWMGVLVFVGWWGVKARGAEFQLKVFHVILLAAVYALFVLLLPEIAEILHLYALGVAKHAQALHRLDLWWQMILAVMQGGPWGYGWNQVSVAQIGVSLVYPVALVVEHSHNIVLDILIWNGPVIGVAIVAFFACWFSWLAIKAKSKESVFGVLAVGLILLHGMLELPLEYAYFLIPAGVLLGMLEADMGLPNAFALPRWLGGLVLVFGVVSLGWVWQEYGIAEEDHRLMRFESSRIGNLRAEQAAPDIVLLTQLREFLRFARTEAAPGMDEGQLEQMRKIAHRYPYPPCLFRYALALALNNHPDQARIELMRLKSLHGEELYREALNGIDALVEKYPQLASMDRDE
ncbi:Wzy polymerase domain-containing protein [Pseudomonas sp. BN515]|uniref:PglL family O-oligosaccharyltransferase n=1 Tax=Pseudomonas sp. BN515 TaxID=2567892 RepID=UPI0024580CD6|nr:Wzy polymerase domain-containing protein [Pseudomonas sp. BN515]MDH4873309.1 hypothetical protein [Pseudomonas sp. BN515]